VVGQLVRLSPAAWLGSHPLPPHDVQVEETLVVAIVIAAASFVSLGIVDARPPVLPQGGDNAGG
jgi:hypothetical protein